MNMKNAKTIPNTKKKQQVLQTTVTLHRPQQRRPSLRQLTADTALQPSKPDSLNRDLRDLDLLPQTKMAVPSSQNGEASNAMPSPSLADTLAGIAFREKKHRFCGETKTPGATASAIQIEIPQKLRVSNQRRCRNGEKSHTVCTSQVKHQTMVRPLKE